MEGRPRVAIVGGGISGLATAYYLTHPDNVTRYGGPAPEVTLIEAGPRLGGKIRTRDIDGLPVDVGSDAFLTRAPDLRELIDALDLRAAVVGGAKRRSYVLSRGRLRPLPPGTVFGIPQRLVPLLRSGLLSPLGVLRAAGDLVLPRRELTADPSVQELLQPRFGSQVYNRLIDPLLGGVHAGRAHLLSANSAVPDIAAIARRSHSIYLALRRRAAAGGTAPQAGPVLAGLDGGLVRLVAALSGALTTQPYPVMISTDATARTVERAPSGYRIVMADGPPVTADAVVLATPAFVTARLLDQLLPAAASVLDEVPYADVASIVAEYSPAAVGRKLDGTGYLVPPEEGLLTVGCTWLSAKWPYLADGRTVLIRCAVGRHDDARWTALDDTSLIEAVHQELAPVLRLSERPLRATVQRWPGGLPQYTVGHGDRLTRIDTAVASCTDLYLTGAAYRGVGLAGCVAQARQTAGAVIAGLSRTIPVSQET